MSVDFITALRSGRRIRWVSGNGFHDPSWFADDASGCYHCDVILAQYDIEEARPVEHRYGLVDDYGRTTGSFFTDIVKARIAATQRGQRVAEVTLV